jgi:hypothetical protein
MLYRYRRILNSLDNFSEVFLNKISLKSIQMNTQHDKEAADTQQTFFVRSSVDKNVDMSSPFCFNFMQFVQKKTWNQNGKESTRKFKR